MTDLERLIELLKPYMSAEPCEHESGSCELGSCRECRARDIADHLIENGVILPPCKVGDTMWCLRLKDEITKCVVYSVEVTRFSVPEMWIAVEYEDEVGEIRYYHWKESVIGKTLFHTREEAEAALERRKEANTT